MVNQARLIEEFCELVSVDATSYREREMADLLIKKLTELGFEVEEDRAGEAIGGNSGNLYGYLKGDLQGAPILFSSHMDTVVPGNHKKAIVREDGTITSDGTTVLGADDLSGITAILEAVRTIKDLGLPHRSIELLLPVAEEVYILGSGLFDYRKIKAREAYVLDLDGPVGTAARKAPTLVSITAKIIGKASHAGFAPEQGIHAIAIAAEAITRMEQGRIDEETTVNIGQIEGGAARNIVPEECILKGEVRSLNHEKAIREAEKLITILNETAAKHKAHCEINTSFGCIAYEIELDHPVILRFTKACEELQLPVKLINTFGGSDNNNFVRNGIAGIVLACGMNKVHSCQEYTTVKELERCSELVLKLMTQPE